MKVSDRVEASNGRVAEMAVPVAGGKRYLYAVVEASEPRSYASMGIDGSDVYTLSLIHI